MYNLIPNFIVDRFNKNELTGTFQTATMFIDISGFTQMTRELMSHGKEGAEVLNDILNNVFKPVINAVYENGGDITSFEGDAFTAVFRSPVSRKPGKSPGFGESGLHCAAKKIISLFKKRGHQKTKFGTFDLSVKIGLSCGDVEWGIVGSDDHKTWYFKGMAIDDAVRAEKLCARNQISIVGDRTFSLSSPASRKPGKSPGFGESGLHYKFFPESVVDFTGKGEFRDVACAFISFKNLSSPGELDKFAVNILDKAYEHGGYFEGLNFGDKGGNCLVIFGAPTAYENNVERAADFVNAVRNDYSDIRAGVTFGTVFAGLKGSKRRAIYGVIGEVVNMSARLMMKADWGKVLLDKSVYNRIKSVYKIKANRPISLKGFRGFTSCYTLLERQKGRVAFFEGDLVGRKKELNRLSRFLRPIRNRKFGGIVTVYGEPGIGKSRLLYEFTENQNLRTLTLQCDSILKESLNPFTYLFNHYFDQSDANSPDERKSCFMARYKALIEQVERLSDERARSAGEELKRVEPLIGSLVGIFWEGSIYEQIDPKDRPLAIRFAVKEFFKAFSLIEPVALLIEDIQWLDDESQALFAILTRKIEDYSIVILASSRFNDDGSKPVLKVDKEISKKELILAELPSEDLNRLIATQLGGDADVDLSKYIHSRTEGNPFYAEQICLYLKENDMISSPAEGERFKLSKQQVDIPTSINAIMIARIDRLSGELKETVQVASVLGREFEVQVLGELLKLLHQTETGTRSIYRDRNIKSLITGAEKERIWAALSELRYIFSHALLREAAYEMQLKAQIRTLHRIAGDTIVKLFPDDKSKLADIAWHYEKGEEWEKAAEYLQKAANYAKERFDNQAALKLYDHLLSLRKYHPEVVSPQTACNAMIDKGEVLQLIGNWAESERLYIQTLESSENLHDTTIIIKSLSALGSIYHLQNNNDRALEFFNRTLSITSELGDRKEIANSLGKIAAIFENRGDYDGAFEYYQRALLICEKLGDKKGISTIIGNMGIVIDNRGDWDGAIKNYQRALSICEEFGNRQGVSTALINLGGLFGRRGDFDRAMECFQKSLSISEELGDKQGILIVIGNMGVVFNMRGDIARALECHQRSISIAEEMGARSDLAYALFRTGGVFYTLGDYEKALGLFRRALTISEELGDKSLTSSVLSDIGFLLRKMSDLDGSLECFQQALSIAEELEHKQQIAIAIGNMGAALFDRGDYAQAIKCLNRQLSIHEEMGEKRGVSNAVCRMGVVHETRGDFEKAMKCYQRSISIAEELEDKYCNLTALGNMGNIFFELKDYENAKEHCGQAINLCREIQAKYELSHYLSAMSQTNLELKCYSIASDQCCEALKLAQELKNTEFIFQAQILSHKISFFNTEDNAARIAAIDSLNTMLEQSTEDEQCAEIHFELTSMHHILNHLDKAEQHRLEAIRLYKILYEKIPKYLFKKRLEGLLGGGGPKGRDII